MQAIPTGPTTLCQSISSPADYYNLARHVAGCVTEEEEDGIGDVGWVCDSPQRNLLREMLGQFCQAFPVRVVEMCPGDEGRVCHPRRHRVHTQRVPVLSPSPSQAYHGMLGGAIDRETPGGNTDASNAGYVDDRTGREVALGTWEETLGDFGSLLAHPGDGFGAHVPRPGDVDGEDTLIQGIGRQLAFGRADSSPIDETVEASRDGFDKGVAGRPVADIHVSDKMNIGLAVELRRSLPRDIGDVDGRTFSCQRLGHREANSRGASLVQKKWSVRGATSHVGQRYEIKGMEQQLPPLAGCTYRDRYGVACKRDTLR